MGEPLLASAATAGGGAWHWPPWTFPLAFWQPVFVGGFVAAPALRWLRGGGPARLAMWAASASVVYAALLLARHGAI